MKAGWVTSTLGNTCEMYQPKTISSKEMMGDGLYPVFGANGVIGRYNQFNHEEPQLLVTCRGATCGTINVSEPKSWITGNAMVVRPKNGVIHPRFLEYLLRGGLDITPAITGAAQPQITRANLNPIEIRYPLDSREQRRIVAILDAAFAAIATARAHTEQNLRNARELFESQLAAVFSQRGAGWVTKPLGELCEFQRGLTYSKSNEVDFSDNIVLRANNIDLATNTLNFSELKYIEDSVIVPVAKKVCKNSTIICTASGSKSHLGKAAYIDDDYGYAFGGFMGQLTPSSSIHGRYLFHALTTPDYKNFIQNLSDGANINNLKFDDLKQFTIPAPPLPEQHRIVEKLDAAKAQSQTLQSLAQRKLAALDELKQSLLQQAFSGQL